MSVSLLPIHSGAAEGTHEMRQSLVLAKTLDFRL